MVAGMEGLQAWLFAGAGQWWSYAIVGVCACVDAFFPTVPSESLLVALGAFSAHVPALSLALLVASGWAGAFIGDHIAYFIGCKVGVERFHVLRSGRGAELCARARGALENHSFLFFATARFIPLGRTAVNVSAGALGYSRSRFSCLVLAATFMWSAYSVGIGVLAGHWLQSHPLLGIVLALVLSGALSVVVDAVARRWSLRVRVGAERNL